MDTSPIPQPVSTPTPPAFRIKVLGVGGAGGNALRHLHLAGEALDGVEFHALNTDAAALTLCPVPNQLVLGSKGFRGLGAGGDPERGRQAALDDQESIRELCQNASIVFVVAGLGGGTGTGASPVIARIAKEAGALVFAIVLLPFECEGPQRQRRALEGLQTLKQACDGVLCLPNQKVFKLVDENTSLVEAFSLTNEFVAQGIRGIWRLLSRPGLINVDFADLCSVTRGRHASSVLITVEASGDQRIHTLLDQLQNHPLFESGQVLTDASGILVCIAGGPSLGMKDVERLMHPIQRSADQAHIIMGASIDPQLADRVILTLVASCGPSAETPKTPPAPTQTIRPSHLPHSTPQPTAESVHEPISGSRNTAPPPDLFPAQTADVLQQRGARKKSSSRLRQTQLPLELLSKGRFEKSEPTLYRGEDLDVPTYIRRGVPLN